MGKFIDLVGQRFEKLLVLEYAGKDKHGHSRWKVVCDCGTTKSLPDNNFKSGNSRSCGCVVSSRFTKHGHSGTRHAKRSPEYVAWKAMKQRCFNPNTERYPKHGALGITICDRWNISKGGSFQNFLSDMGERPAGTSLGRFGDVGNYEPGNCKWMTQAEQVANRRPDRIYRNKWTGKKEATEQVAA